jgi:hypothetical protein
MKADPAMIDRAASSADSDVSESVDPIAEASVRFRLYLTYPAPTSVRARSNLDAILLSLGDAARNISIETIDIASNPLRASKDRVIVTPTLMLCSGRLPQAIVGDLGNTSQVRGFIEAALTAVAAG